jgi:hypothetical protein
MLTRGKAMPLAQAPLTAALARYVTSDRLAFLGAIVA